MTACRARDQAAALVGEEGARPVERGRDDRHRGLVLGVAHALEEEALELVLAGEQHLALVGEVAEERPLGDASGRGDPRDGGAVEPVLGEQGEGGGLQPLASAGLPPHHGAPP